jgi:anti-sigma factor RsiW
MTCHDLIEFLDLYLDGGLQPTRRALFDSHLDECPDCRSYVRSYRLATLAGRRAMSLAPPTPVPSALIEAVLAAAPVRE